MKLSVEKNIIFFCYICPLSSTCYIGDLFWKLSNSNFGGGPFPKVSAQTGLNWFLLSLQTAKPSTKKDMVDSIIKFFGPNISSFFDMIMPTALKDTRQ